jgi:hypothetical protein
MPTFLTSLQLRDILLDQITTNTSSSGGQSATNRLDILSYLHLAALDIIGLAGFNYDFNTLRDGEGGNELAAALRRVNSPENFEYIMLLKGFIPAMRMIKFDRHAQMKAELHRMVRRIGMALIDEGQREIATEKASCGGTVLEKSE